MKRPLETFPGDDTCAFALENVADAVFAVDRDFIVRYCNLAAGEIARTDPAEAVGRTCREVSASPTAARPACCANAWKRPGPSPTVS